MSKKGEMVLRDNVYFNLELQYFPETVKTNIVRNIDERPIPRRSFPVNWDVSSGALTFEFETMFNSYGEAFDHTPPESVWGSFIRDPATLLNNSLPRGASDKMDWLLMPEVVDVEPVWVLSLCYPLDGVEVLIESLSIERQFFSKDGISKRAIWTLKGRLHHSLPELGILTRKPKNVKKSKYICGVDMDDPAAAQKLIDEVRKAAGL